MDSNQIGDAATKARETSRTKTTGRFGTQPHHDSGVVTSEPVREQSLVDLPADFTPSYETWRHGGWYVTNVRYLSGASGCVSRNFPDRKWRIVCYGANFEDQPTFKTRDEAAAAEYLHTREPRIIRRDIREMRSTQDSYRARGYAADDTLITQYDPWIVKAEKLLTDAGLPLDEN